MSIMEFKREMLLNAVSTAKLLAEVSLTSDIKKEPEQIRRNIATILSALHDVEDFLNELEGNICSGS